MSRFSKILEELDGVPFVFPQKLGDDVVEFSSTRLKDALGEFIFGLRKSWSQSLLKRESGYDQTDGTYALFNATKQRLLESSASDWESLDSRTKALCRHEGGKIILLLLTAFLEGEDEKA